MERRIKHGFAVWITGLPASGKSSLAAALRSQLASRGMDVAVLESDALRPIFTPHPRYDEEERERFYRQMAYVGALLVQHGVPVIFDATANLRSYREQARRQIPRMLEVFVDTSLAACMVRDPKGIYAKARTGAATAVPGLQAVYEPPLDPDVVVHGDREAPEAAALRVIASLMAKRYLVTSAPIDFQTTSKSAR